MKMWAALLPPTYDAAKTGMSYINAAAT